MKELVPFDDHTRIKELEATDFDLLHLNYRDAVKIYDGSSPHRHTFFELFLFETKGDRHEIDFKNFPVSACSVHFVSPSQVHKLDHGKAKGVLFCFNEKLISRADKKKINEAFPFYSLNAHLPFIDLSKKDFSEIKAFVSLIEHEFKLNSPAKFSVIAALLSALLEKLKEKYKAENSTTKKFSVSFHPYIVGFFSLVEKNFINHLSVSDYASLLNISPNYLNALCKKETGKTAVLLIQERTLLEAKRLLYSTTLSIKEISSELNFEDPAYFNRFFKKLSRQTPLFFRQKESNS
jgi:AraC family transcriptional regulator, transcriptional activator of pobA